MRSGLHRWSISEFLNPPCIVRQQPSLSCRAEREAPVGPGRRNLPSESPPQGSAPARRDPDLRPMGALLAASLAEVPGCDLAVEKTWLYEKQYEVDNVKKQDLFCSLCNRWSTRRHRLSKGHVEKINHYGDRNLYMRAKREPEARSSTARASRGGDGSPRRMRSSRL